MRAGEGEVVGSCERVWFLVSSLEVMPFSKFG